MKCPFGQLIARDSLIFPFEQKPPGFRSRSRSRRRRGRRKSRSRSSTYRSYRSHRLDTQHSLFLLHCDDSPGLHTVQLITSTLCFFSVSCCFQSNIQHESFPESLVHPAPAIQVRFQFWTLCFFSLPNLLAFTQKLVHLGHCDASAGRTRTTATRAGAAV